MVCKAHLNIKWMNALYKINAFIYLFNIKILSCKVLQSHNSYLGFNSEN